MPPNYLVTGSGLVAYWTLDGADVNWTTGRVADVSGQGNHGYVQGLSTSTAPDAGKVGQVLSFDGSDDAVNVGDLSATEGASQLTWSYWAYTNTFTNLASHISKLNSGTVGSWEMGYSTGCGAGNRLYARISASEGDGNSLGCTPANAVTAGRWEYYTVVFDGIQADNVGRLKIYIDGVLQTLEFLGTIPASTISTTQTTWIGRSGNGTYNSTKIDDLRIYNRALRHDEIIKLYNLGATTKIGKSPVQAVSDGLVAYWTFDGSDVNWATGQVLDKSGNGRHGTIDAIATTTGIESGKIGQAMNFDGVDDNVYTSAFSIGNATATVMAWVKYGSAGSLQWVVHQQAGGNQWQLRHGGGYRDDTGWVLDNDPNGKLGEWRHTAVVFAGSYTKIYRNSVLDTTGAGGYAVNATAPVYIGETPGNGFYGGAIDDVRIYNRELRPDEIQKIYNLGATTKFGVAPTQALTDGLVGYWTMDGKDVNWTTGRVNDRSGQGNNGYLQGLMSTSTVPDAGKIGQALNMDGSNDYVYVASTHFATPENWAISAWVNPNNYSGTGAGHKGIFINGDDLDAGGNSGFFLQMRITDGYPRIDSVVGANVTDILVGTSPLPTRTWTHVVAVKNGTAISLYRNGSLENSATLSSATMDYTANLPVTNMGTRSDFTEANFPGAIDDVRVYGRALRADEVQKLYEMGR